MDIHRLDNYLSGNNSLSLLNLCHPQLIIFCQFIITHVQSCPLNFCEETIFRLFLCINEDESNQNHPPWSILSHFQISYSYILRMPQYALKMPKDIALTIYMYINVFMWMRLYIGTNSIYSNTITLLCNSLTLQSKAGVELRKQIKIM